MLLRPAMFAVGLCGGSRCIVASGSEQHLLMRRKVVPSFAAKVFFLAPLVNRFFVQRDVVNIFRYRFKKLEEIFPPGSPSRSSGEAT